MRFFRTGLVSATLVAIGFAASIIDFPSEVQTGRSYRITYTPGGDIPTTLILRKGRAENLGTVGTLTDGATNGVFTWSVDESLPEGDDYALEIKQGDDESEYSGWITVQSADLTAASSSSSSPPASPTPSASPTLSLSTSKAARASSTGASTTTAPTSTYSRSTSQVTNTNATTDSTSGLASGNPSSSSSPSSSPSISTGAVAGLSVGVTLAVVLLSMGAYMIWRRRRRLGRENTAIEGDRSEKVPSQEQHPVAELPISMQAQRANAFYEMEGPGRAELEDSEALRTARARERRGELSGL